MDVLKRFDEVSGLVRRAAFDCDRDPASIALVAVSKLFSADKIIPVLDAGHRRFGENYVQEAKLKWPALREAYAETVLHLIGPLQSNKARDAVAIFDVIETLDRESLAKELAREITRQGRKPALLIQVNTGDEPQKGGISLRTVDDFITLCCETYELPIAGLMCIPPAEQPPSPHFALLGQIARRNGLTTLSMGMSADFQAAIQLGATHIRVGSAIFGTRA